MNFLKTTQYKIAILISVVTSLFVLITSFSIILIFNTRIDHSAKNSLFSEINKLQVEVEQENIQDKDLKLKENQLTKDEYVFNRVLPNISSESEKIEQPTDINIQKLEESKIVFSKVIDSKGNIVSTSELFQNYVIDTAREGFAKHNVSNTVCLYSYSFHVSSGEYEGYIIQVANYCPINRLELGILYTLCVAISIVISLTTYIGGFIIAKMHCVCYGFSR